MFFVYMLSSKPYGTLYTGVTSDLHKRVWEHKTALRREKQIKEWQRNWKIELIERDDPRWLDLSIDLPL